MAVLVAVSVLGETLLNVVLELVAVVAVIVLGRGFRKFSHPDRSQNTLVLGMDVVVGVLRVVMHLAVADSAGGTGRNT